MVMYIYTTSGVLFDNIKHQAKKVGIEEVYADFKNKDKEIEEEIISRSDVIIVVDEDFIPKLNYDSFVDKYSGKYHIILSLLKEHTLIEKYNLKKHFTYIQKPITENYTRNTIKILFEKYKKEVEENRTEPRDRFDRKKIYAQKNKETEETNYKNKKKDPFIEESSNSSMVVSNDDNKKIDNKISLEKEKELFKQKLAGVQERKNPSISFEEKRKKITAENFSFAKELGISKDGYEEVDNSPMGNESKVSKQKIIKDFKKQPPKNNISENLAFSKYIQESNKREDHTLNDDDIENRTKVKRHKPIQMPANKEADNLEVLMYRVDAALIKYRLKKMISRGVSINEARQYLKEISKNEIVTQKKFEDINKKKYGVDKREERRRKLMEKLKFDENRPMKSKNKDKYRYIEEDLKSAKISTNDREESEEVRKLGSLMISKKREEEKKEEERRRIEKERLIAENEEKLRKEKEIEEKLTGRKKRMIDSTNKELKQKQEAEYKEKIEKLKEEKKIDDSISSVKKKVPTNLRDNNKDRHIEDSVNDFKEFSENQRIEKEKALKKKQEDSNAKKSNHLKDKQHIMQQEKKKNLSSPISKEKPIESKKIDDVLKKEGDDNKEKRKVTITPPKKKKQSFTFEEEMEKSKKKTPSKQDKEEPKQNKKDVRKGLLGLFKKN